MVLLKLLSIIFLLCVIGCDSFDRYHTIEEKYTEKDEWTEDRKRVKSFHYEVKWENK
jgi:hypothetical protein